MLKVGITGQSGFIGSHLFNTLGLYPERFVRVSFEDYFFQQEMLLDNFVHQCDIIIHLAALNRHDDPKTIYQINVLLVKKLIDSMIRTNSLPHVMFASSIQEERENSYGQSKKDGRLLFEKWASQNNAIFTGLIIPNVFGPFGNPYYNSVIATFCHQLTHGEIPKIEIDSEVKLIYVGDLINEFIKLFDTELKCSSTQYIPHSNTILVSLLLEKIEKIKSEYFDFGIIPDIRNTFDRNLFNTFICYINYDLFFPFKLKMNSDDRGFFVETIKLNSGGQVSFSSTVPGVTRGNHFHTRKAERFAIITGRALIEIRRIGTDRIFSFNLDGNNPSFVDMPIWHSHKVTNTGDEDLYIIFWINEHYDANDPDTFFENV